MSLFTVFSCGLRLSQLLQFPRCVSDPQPFGQQNVKELEETNQPKLGDLGPLVVAHPRPLGQLPGSGRQRNSPGSAILCGSVEL